MRLNLLILLAFYTEKLHRYVYDNIYLQNGRPFSKKNKLIILIYSFFFSLNPRFRWVLKYKKKLFFRAYEQHRLSFKYVMGYQILRKWNYDRYSDITI